MVALQVVEEVTALPALRWCGWCRHMTRYGWHHANGDFDFSSVTVNPLEVECQYVLSLMAKNYNRTFEQIRRNIALGMHAGARD